MKNKSYLALLGLFICCSPANSALISDQSAEEQYATYKSLFERLQNGEKRKQIENVLPHLGINIDRALKLSRARWAYSQNYDEFARAEILPLKILQALGIPSDFSSTIAHVPAGVMHTYGYLFSQLKTSYGLKGKRWVESRIDERLGLAKGMFSPSPPQGEFLKNLTIALDNLTDGKNGSSTLRGVKEERVEWLIPSGLDVKTVLKRGPPTWVKRTGVIKTFFYTLRKLSENEDQKDTLLLVYRVQFSDEGAKARAPLYVTAFPVNEDFFKGVSDQPKGVSVDFKPRYNLYIDPTWKVIRYENLGVR